jgi:hypothetical protein
MGLLPVQHRGSTGSVWTLPSGKAVRVCIELKSGYSEKYGVCRQNYATYGVDSSIRTPMLTCHYGLFGTELARSDGEIRVVLTSCRVLMRSKTDQMDHLL